MVLNHTRLDSKVKAINQESRVRVIFSSPALNSSYVRGLYISHFQHFNIFSLTHDVETLFQIKLYNESPKVLELVLHALYNVNKWITKGGNAS